MFAFPPSTAFGKAIPKSRILTRVSLTSRVKGLFTSQLAGIVWAHKLSPETLHLPATPAVPEIQVFDLRLKGAVLDEAVLHAIDRAIPFPILHRLRSEDGIAFSAAYKRPSEADSSQWVTGVRFTTGFQVEADPPPLPAVLDLGRLYGAIFERLLPLPARPGENLPSHLLRCEAHQGLSRQIDQLTAKLHREKQFNRKVELNQQLKPLLAQRAGLEGEHTRPRVSFPAPSPETGPNHPPTSEIPSVPAPESPGTRGRGPEHARERVLPDS